MARTASWATWGGMPGACGGDGPKLVLSVIWRLLLRPYALLDIGASSGRMLFLARAMGAMHCMGLEVQGDLEAARRRPISGSKAKEGGVKEGGLRTVYRAALALLEKSGAAASSVHITFNADIGKQSSLELAAQLPESVSKLPIAVYAFCDVFSADNRQKMFQLVRGDSRMQVIMCSPGKGKHDMFSNAGAILAALNVAARAARLSEFKRVVLLGLRGPPGAGGLKLDRDGNVIVRMKGSGSQKTLYVFSRLPLPPS